MKTMESLSFRQLCLISIVNKISLIPFDFPNNKGERQEEATSFRRMDLVSDLIDLSQKGIGLVEMSKNFNNLPIHFQENDYSKLISSILKLENLDNDYVINIRKQIIENYE